ncbi:hypothetical protein [Caballeronia sordidicola]|jgi:hypothetical protein
MMETLVAWFAVPPRTPKAHQMALPVSDIGRSDLPSPACEALMTTKPSERIVVFVTPAQKLAITSTADGLGVSVSELMRRAILSFNATSEQVKAASLVDRLRAPKTPDLLNVALRQVAERAAAREARDAALVAKVASKRTLAAEGPKSLPAPLPALEPQTDDVLPQTCDSGEDLGASDESDGDASFSGRA